MAKIKVLDCTLRDGGYVNEWNFKEKNIKFIIDNLAQAKCDYIECGFLKDICYNKDKSLFQSFSQLEELLPKNTNSNFTLMINYGEIPIEKIEKCNTEINLRIVFKKEKRVEALEYCQKLVEKGYKIFINPMNTNTYSSTEMLELIEKVNEIKPVALTIVDTTGAMNKKSLLSFYYLIDGNLDESIALCFHSHNNLQLSFSNAQVLLDQNSKRTVIIDATVFGMGRGAGNLCMELLIRYINDCYNGTYDIIPILKIIDEQINNIFSVTPWGYSVSYYLAAVKHCHPNYAKFLIDKQTVPVEMVARILAKIPEENKGTYNKELISELYRETLSTEINDTTDLELLSKLLSDKEILLLASGKSLIDDKEEINNYITKYNPFIISLNFIPQKYNADMLFATNIKRYNDIENINIPSITTSNINSKSKYKLNFSSFSGENTAGDNVALILLKVLIKLGIKEISIAGFDGYSQNSSDNYAEDSLISAITIQEYEKKNKVIKNALRQLEKNIKVNFITKSLYENKQ